MSIISALLVLPFTANSALLAITDNEIHGTAPKLSNDGGSTVFDLDEVLGFTMPDGITKHTNKDTDPIMISSLDSFNAYTTFVEANGTPSTLPPSYYYDDNGDEPDTTPVSGKVTATWYNGTTKITNLAEKPSVCEGPYTLKIETTDVVVKSKYGNPMVNNYGTTSKTYNFTVDGYFTCYLRPAEMTVHSGETKATTTSSAYPYQSTTNPGGYNPEKWVYEKSIHKGFNGSSKFPTTGFVGGQFQMVMSGGNQSLFEFSSSDSEKALINSLGNVTLLAKPSGPITLTAKLKSDNSIVVTHTFTIEKWALPQPVKYAYGNGEVLTSSNSFSALDRCRTVVGDTTVEVSKTTKQQAAGQNEEDKTWRKKYLYTREEFTNSPFNKSSDFPGGKPENYGGYFSRDIGSFMGEWGNVYSYGNGWQGHTWYWTSEAWTANMQFIIINTGTVYYTYPKYGNGTVCRGD